MPQSLESTPPDGTTGPAGRSVRVVRFDDLADGRVAGSGPEAGDGSSPAVAGVAGFATGEAPDRRAAEREERVAAFDRLGASGVPQVRVAAFDGLGPTTGAARAPAGRATCGEASTVAAPPGQTEADAPGARGRTSVAGARAPARRAAPPDAARGRDDGPPADAVPRPDAPPPDGPLPRGRRRTRRGAAGPGPGPGLEPTELAADPVAVAREICLRLLTERARTRQELATALARKGVPPEAAAAVLGRFTEVGLIDDATFAGQWVHSRHRYRGLGRRAIAAELRRKGVADDVAGEALAEVDSESEARRARELVDRKLRSLAVGTPEQRASAARRLVGMLARKGYGASIAYGVVRAALAERGADVDELGTEPAD